MSEKLSLSGRILGLAGGCSVVVIISILNSIVTDLLVYGLAGTLLSFIWPKGSWRWGLWLSVPLWFFVGVSVAFAGYFHVFLTKDLPLLLGVLISSCTGAYLGARFKSRIISKKKPF